MALYWDLCTSAVWPNPGHEAPAVLSGYWPLLMPNFSEIWQFCELSNLNLCAQPHNGILALDIIARTIARTYSLHMPWLRYLCLVYLLGDVFVSVIPPSHWVGGLLRRQCRRLMQKVDRSTHSILCFTNHDCNIEFSEHKCTAIDINDKQHHRHIIILDIVTT